MENSIGAIASVLFGCLGIGVAACHEFAWRKRLRNSICVVGQVVDVVELEHDSLDSRLQIEFSVNAKNHLFLSNYSAGSETVGDKVNVVCGKFGDNPEHLKLSNRWLFTLAPLMLGAVFVAAGIGSLTIRS